MTTINFSSALDLYIAYTWFLLFVWCFYISAQFLPGMIKLRPDVSTISKSDFFRPINPFVPESDVHLIYSHSITAESHLEFMRIKIMVVIERSSWLINEFSFQFHLKCKNANWRKCRVVSVCKGFYRHKLKDRLIVPFECFDEQGVVLEIRWKCHWHWSVESFSII